MKTVQREPTRRNAGSREQIKAKPPRIEPSLDLTGNNFFFVLSEKRL
jgi:hypothetical protein